MRPLTVFGFKERSELDAAALYVVQIGDEARQMGKCCRRGNLKPREASLRIGLRQDEHTECRASV